MAEKLDLLKIAQEEQNGDLFKLLDSIYKRSNVQPRRLSTSPRMTVTKCGSRWSRCVTSYRPLIGAMSPGPKRQAAALRPNLL